VFIILVDFGRTTWQLVVDLRQMCRKVIVEFSVADPDPHGSAAFGQIWIRMFLGS
jgi:hypothetical protein